MSTLTTCTCASAAAVACDTVADSAAVTAAAVVAAVVMSLVVSVCGSHQVAPLTVNFVCNGVDSLTRDL